MHPFNSPPLPCASRAHCVISLLPTIVPRDYQVIWVNIRFEQQESIRVFDDTFEYNKVQRNHMHVGKDNGMARQITF